MTVGNKLNIKQELLTPDVFKVIFVFTSMLFSLYFLPFWFDANNTYEIAKYKYIVGFAIAVIIVLFNKRNDIYLVTTVFLVVYFVQVIFEAILGDPVWVAANKLYIFSMAMVAIFLRKPMSETIVVVINDILFISGMVVTILIMYNIILLQDGFIYRPHFMIQFYIMLLVVGFDVDKKNIIALCVLTALLAIFSYESRVAILTTIILLVPYYKFIYIFIAAALVAVGAIYLDAGQRISDVGLEDFGRDYIYQCYYENLINSNSWFTTNRVFDECNSVFEYAHSSHLVMLDSFGFLLFLVMGIAAVATLVKHALLEFNLQKICGYTAALIYASVEGGVEWIYIFSIVDLFLSKSFLQSGRRKIA